MALFYLSIALGTSGASVLAGWYDTAHQVGYFAAIGIASILVGTALLLAARPLARALHAREPQPVTDTVALDGPELVLVGERAWRPGRH